MFRALLASRAAVPALVVAVALLAACSDDDAATAPSAPSSPSSPSSVAASSTIAAGSAAESEYVDALADNIKIDDRDMAACIASALVDAVGFDGIRDSGMSPAELARGDTLDEHDLSLEASQAPDLVRGFVACGDIAEAYISAESVPDAQKECERGVLTNQLTAELLATQLTGAPQRDELTAAAQQASACREPDTSGPTTPTTTG